MILEHNKKNSLDDKRILDNTIIQDCTFHLEEIVCKEWNDDDTSNELAELCSLLGRENFSFLFFWSSVQCISCMAVIFFPF